SLSPRRGGRPPAHDDDAAADPPPPPQPRWQKPRGPELAGEARGGEAQAGERCGQREARDGDPKLQLPLAGAPDRPGATPAGERHPDSEEEAAPQRPCARAWEHPLPLVPAV